MFGPRSNNSVEQVLTHQVSHFDKELALTTRVRLPLSCILLLTFAITPALAAISVTSPTANSSSTSPVRFKASASPNGSFPISSMAIYVDNILQYSLGTSSVDVFLPLSIGQHHVVFQSWDTSGAVQKSSLYITAKYGVTVESPSSGTSVNSPVHVSASAKSSSSITALKIYVDGTLKASTSSSSFDTSISIPSGSHSLTVQALNSSGTMCKDTRTINVITTSPQLRGRDQFLQQKYQAGITHIDGRYGFTLNNFLLEGASSIRNFGAHGIFVYLFPHFRTSYPDKSANL